MIKWRNCFRKLGSTADSNEADHLETQYIEEACEEYIRDPHKPSPLNQRAGVGNGILLQAAWNLYELRTAPLRERLASLEQERDRLRNQNDALTSQLSEAPQGVPALQECLASLEQERDRFRNQNDALTRLLSEAQEQHSASVDRLASLEQERDRLRNQNDALTTQLSEAPQGVPAFQERLASLEQERDRLRNQNDALTRRLSEAQEQHPASVDRLASLEQELKQQQRLVKRLERKAYGDARERERLERKISIAAEIQKSERRRRTLFFAILVVIATLAAGVSFIEIENPDVMEQGRELLSSLLQNGSMPMVAPLSHTPRPIATPTPMPTPTATPRPASTPTVTRTPNPSLAPRLLNARFAGVIARACPRMDCDILARLARGSQVTITDEVQGEAYRGSTLWYRVALPDAPADAFVHSSLLGPPSSALDG